MPDEARCVSQRADTALLDWLHPPWSQDTLAVLDPAAARCVRLERGRFRAEPVVAGGSPEDFALAQLAGLVHGSCMWLPWLDLNPVTVMGRFPCRAGSGLVRVTSVSMGLEDVEARMRTMWDRRPQSFSRKAASPWNMAGLRAVAGQRGSRRSQPCRRTVRGPRGSKPWRGGPSGAARPGAASGRLPRPRIDRRGATQAPYDLQGDLPCLQGALDAACVHVIADQAPVAGAVHDRPQVMQPFFWVLTLWVSLRTGGIGRAGQGAGDIDHGVTAGMRSVKAREAWLRRSLRTGVKAPTGELQSD